MDLKESLLYTEFLTLILFHLLGRSQINNVCSFVVAVVVDHNGGQTK